MSYSSKNATIFLLRLAPVRMPMKMTRTTFPSPRWRGDDEGSGLGRRGSNQIKMKLFQILKKTEKVIKHIEILKLSICIAQYKPLAEKINFNL